AVRVWPLPRTHSWQSEVRLPDRAQALHAVGSPSGWVAVSREGRIMVSSLESTNSASTVAELPPGAGEVTTTMVSGDGGWLIVATEAGWLTQWRMPGFVLCTNLPAHTDRVTALALHAAEGEPGLFSAGADGQVIRWRFNPTLTRAGVLDAIEPVTAMAISPDGRFVAIASAGRGSSSA